MDVDTVNAGIPYADSFYVALHWCVVKVSAREARIVVKAEIKYKKSVWGLVKSEFFAEKFRGIYQLLDD